MTKPDQSKQPTDPQAPNLQDSESIDAADGVEPTNRYVGKNADDSATGEESENDSSVSSDGESQLSALETVTKERDDYLDRFRRAQADFINYQRRMRSQAESEKPYAIAPLAKDLLPVLDSFDRAIDAARKSENDAIITGLEMVQKQLIETLGKHGVEAIDAVDQPFDPNQHEALTQMQVEGKEEGIVVSEFERGYKIKDRVLRPSRVAVSA